MRQSVIPIILVAGLLGACSKPSAIVAAQANGGSVQICISASGLTPNGPVAVHALWPTGPVEPIGNSTAYADGNYSQMATIERGRCAPIGQSPNVSYPDVDVFVADVTTSGIVVGPVNQGYFCPSIQPQPGPDPNWAKCCAKTGAC
jgi:hypothetical protein